MLTMERCHFHLIQSVFQNNIFYCFVYCFEIRKTDRHTLITERSRHIIGTQTGFNRSGVYGLDCRVMKYDLLRPNYIPEVRQFLHNRNLRPKNFTLESA